MTQYLGNTRHFFLLTLFNFKNIGGGSTCPPAPLLRGPCIIMGNVGDVMRGDVNTLIKVLAPKSLLHFELRGLASVILPRLEHKQCTPLLFVLSPFDGPAYRTGEKPSFYVCQSGSS